MSTAVYAVIVSAAFFASLVLVYKMFRLCAGLRKSLAGKTTQCLALERERNELRRTVAALATTNDDMAARLAEMLREQFCRPMDRED